MVISLSASYNQKGIIFTAVQRLPEMLTKNRNMTNRYSDKFYISFIATYTMKTTSSLFTQLEFDGRITGYMYCINANI